MKESKIFGLRPVIEAIESKRPIDKVWIVKSSNSKLHLDLTSKLKKNKILFPQRHQFEFSTKAYYAIILEHYSGAKNKSDKAHFM